MAVSSFGVNAPQAVKLWSRKLFREALKNTTMAKYMGEGSDSMIQVLNDTKKGPGDTIYTNLRMQLSGAGIQGDSTLEGNEEALTLYRDSLVVDQLRHAVRSGGKMSDQRIPFSVREEARMGLQDWWADRIDTALMNQLTGNTDQSDTRYTGNNATTAPTYSATPGSTRIVYVDIDDSTDASISTTATITLAAIDKAVVAAKTSNPLVRPIMVNGEPRYVLFLHPYQVRDLRAATTANGAWADFQKALIQGGQKDNAIFTGALGMYNGCILVENTRVPACSASGDTTTPFTVGRRAVLCGAQAAVLAVGQDNNPEKMSWVEELFDYENQLGVSAGMIFGTKKTIFNSLDFGTIALGTYAAA